MSPRLVLGAVVVALAGHTVLGARTSQTFSFRTNVQLINVTATVTDANGRFVSGLHADDFAVFEDGRPQPVQQFEAERVPVSLGIALDTSGSMAGEKIAAAETALNRFLFDLLGDQDEVFLYRFDSRPILVQGWTTNRRAVSRALGSVKPVGGTAIYDTVAEAVRLAQSGSRRKKALVVISDGADTSSALHLSDLAPIIRESEVLIYAIGIDAGAGPSSRSRAAAPALVPSPFPGKAPAPRQAAASGPRHANATGAQGTLERITDESGGRTELIGSARDLDPATAGIADELSRQYFLGYASSAPKDGQWHTIEVRLARPGSYTVRARRGFISN
jgi:Ca-activated chloride channel family protein